MRGADVGRAAAVADADGGVGIAARDAGQPVGVEATVDAGEEAAKRTASAGCVAVAAEPAPGIDRLDPRIRRRNGGGGTPGDIVSLSPPALVRADAAGDEPRSSAYAVVVGPPDASAAVGPKAPANET